MEDQIKMLMRKCAEYLNNNIFNDIPIAPQEEILHRYIQDSCYAASKTFDDDMFVQLSEQWIMYAPTEESLIASLLEFLCNIYQQSYEELKESIVDTIWTSGECSLAEASAVVDQHCDKVRARLKSVMTDDELSLAIPIIRTNTAPLVGNLVVLPYKL